MVLQSHLNLENCMTVRTGYVPQRSNRHNRVTGLPQKRRLLWEEEEQRNERAFVFYTEASDMQLVTTKRTNGDETLGAILRQERRSKRAAKSNVKIKASENGEKVFCPVRLSAQNRALSSSERCLLSGLTFRRFTQRHIKRQKRKVLPVTNASSAAFPAKSRVLKTSALWQTGVTI